VQSDAAGAALNLGVFLYHLSRAATRLASQCCQRRDWRGALGGELSISFLPRPDRMFVRYTSADLPKTVY